ncbi:protease inhibitor Inh/omp19 family protein [Chelativorans intermedius]|uniref:Protease inhibitor Inh/omp19 family protein n=1 Tax=Chelativorans intermedius TaxID=515947 RepID=A0ABV6DAY3_9HYPH|nr:protease inhibitor Inh/omp19 family protein [Chelativorans intermedius]MCT8997894.1 protease inhibitor Inh/omp19 family protein [Chelativorans intermedius]
MPHRKTGILAISLLALGLAGCQSGRFANNATYTPAPLPPAPSGTVTGNQLPPPSAPNSDSAFPAVPEQPGTDMAAVDPQAQAGVEAAAATIEKNSLLGSWTVNSGGTTCQMFLTLTKYGNASRGGTRGCAGVLADMRGWDLAGKQVEIYNDGGETIARLYSSGNERLDGQTIDGAPVTLSR